MTERRILNVFLITILHPNSSPAAVASATIAYQDVANFLNISPKALYVRYRKDFLKVTINFMSYYKREKGVSFIYCQFILQLIMECAVRNYIDFSYNMATTVHRVAKCIGYEGSRHLLRKDGHYAICFLIAFIVEIPKANALLYDVAELINMDIKTMFEEYFPVCKICCLTIQDCGFNIK